MEQNNLVIFILVGMPCSGKSTWSTNMATYFKIRYGTYPIIISRDDIRLHTFGKDYKQNEQDEKKVTELFYKNLSQAITVKNAVVILDNCHVRKKYIDTYLTMFKGMQTAGVAKIYVKFFDISFIKALWRNFWRNWNTGKKIPFKVMWDFHKAYKKLDKTKYEHLNHDFI